MMSFLQNMSDSVSGRDTHFREVFIPYLKRFSKESFHLKDAFPLRSSMFHLLSLTIEPIFYELYEMGGNSFKKYIKTMDRKKCSLLVDSITCLFVSVFIFEGFRYSGNLLTMDEAKSYEEALVSFVASDNRKLILRMRDICNISYNHGKSIDSIFVSWFSFYCENVLSLPVEKVLSSCPKDDMKVAGIIMQKAFVFKDEMIKKALP